MEIGSIRIPGLGAARERESHLRDASYLDLPTVIGTVPIVPMTLRHWVVLDGIDSPFLRRHLPDPHDVPMFLWVLNRKFSAGDSWRRRRFIRSCRSLPFPQAVAAIIGYVNDTFNDSPPTSGNGKGIPCVSFVATVVHRLAFHYHWSEAEILSLPIKRAFQYLKTITRQIDRDASEWEGNSVEKLKGEARREQRLRTATGGKAPNP